MIDLTFSPAKRANVPLLIGIAGPSGSGKTLSALLLAKGMSGGKPFAFIDTERGRALHYADDFDFLHAELDAPFSPQRYTAALEQASASVPPVIVLDSGSHEHAGEGGVLDMHEAELQRLAGEDYKKREAMKFAAWIKPKAAHKAFVQHLLRLRTHVIVALRAEEKIDLVKDENGKLKVVPKRTLAGHVGWIPVSGKDLPYELTLSLVVTPDRPGVPHPIKLQAQHKPFVPLDAPLSEDVGRALAAWAQGSVPGSLAGESGDSGADPDPASAAGADQLTAELTARLIGASSEPDKAAAAIEANRVANANAPDRHLAWLEAQAARIPAEANA